AQSDGGNLGYAMADAVKVINGVIASRSAEPVFFIEVEGDDWIQAGRIPGSTFDFNNLPDGINKLYATPQPAPDSEAQATLKRLAVILHGSETDLNLLTVTAQSLMDRCRADGAPAPVVPEALLSAMEEVLRISDRDHEAWNKAKIGIASCRASHASGWQLPATPDCWCRTCRPVTMNDMRFVVCPDCGNKRCPHANDHRNACTGSNEHGQAGSAYPAAPQQEVTSARVHPARNK
ncbi:hypothetical protein, partial [Citrobacter braakii]|uniref:hypothetical protein n=1 Tax=Citrobacter braakii TaxID=57706 RepID=UPI001EFA25DD